VVFIKSVIKSSPGRSREWRRRKGLGGGVEPFREYRGTLDIRVSWPSCKDPARPSKNLLRNLPNESNIFL